jgi:hypothetical protein
MVFLFSLTRNTKRARRLFQSRRTIKKGPVAGAFVLHYRRPSRTLTGYFFFFGAAFFFAAAFLVAFFID